MKPNLTDIIQHFKKQDEMIEKQHMLIRLQDAIINRQKDEMSQMENLLIKAQKGIKQWSKEAK